jgi:hypothetical protein
MRAVICSLTLLLVPAFAADRIEHANFQVQPIAYEPAAGVPSVMIQGIAGVGHAIAGVPCVACFCVPTRTTVIPMPNQVYAAGNPVTYFFTVEMVNEAGTGDVVIKLLQGSTVIQTLSGTVGFTADFVNLVVLQGQIPNVTGPVDITFTTTLNGETVQGTARIIVL